MTAATTMQSHKRGWMTTGGINGTRNPMARTRLLKPGFFKNPVLARLSERHRLLFAGLWTIANRDGRLKDDPDWIRAELFPYEADINVDALLTDLHRSGFIHRYKTLGESQISTGESTKSLMR